MNEKIIKILRNALHEPAFSLIVSGTDGNTLYVNAPFTDATGFTLEDMIGRKPGAVLQGAETEKDMVNQMHRDLSALRPTHVRVTNYTKAGRKLIFILDIQPVFDNGEHIGFVGIQQDISDSSQDDYYRYHVSNKFLMEITQIRNLLGLVQHDIRDALSGVIMRDQLGILDHAYTMEAVNTCLKITERCSVKSETSYVRNLVDDIFCDVQYRAASKRINLVNQVQDDVEMKISAGYLFIVLRNYIINAIKFGYADSTVTVSQHESYLSVADQGPGMSEDLIETLLTQEAGEIHEPRSRSPQDTTQCGSRTSFIMCRNLLALHGYQVKIQSSSQGTQILVGAI